MKKLEHKNIINEFIKIHGEKYDYSKVIYVNARTKVTITCKEHGDFEQHVNNHKRGEGCPLCGKQISRRKKTQEEFLKECEQVHGNKYNYSKTNYKDALAKVIIICKEHGKFEQVANEHLKGKGCEKCSYVKRGFNKRIGEDVLYEALLNVHDNKYKIEKCQLFNYKDTQKEFIDIMCDKHGIFNQRISNHLHGQGCPKCGISISKGEDEIMDFLSKFIKVEQRIKLENKKEIDLFLPEFNIGIEYNGLRWHSDLFQKNNNYHLDKSNYCSEQGIRLIHIFEDEWLFKKEIVKSRLLNLIGKTSNKIYARKCEIREISPKESYEFLKQNHIQGGLMNSYNIALIYNNQVVSLMTFSSLRRSLGSRKEDNIFELTRFCNKLNTTVIGGASKLLNYFVKQTRPKSIISYADRRWSVGELYINLGFNFVHNSIPNYFYTKGLIRENRFKYRKSELIKQGFDKNKTEKEIMQERGFNRIYDCGTLKFMKTYE